MSDHNNKKKSAKTRQQSSKAPPQIVNFFSKPLSPNNELSPSKPGTTTTTSPPSSNDRKRKLSEHEVQTQSENRNAYADALQKEAVKISKVKKISKKTAATTVTKFFQQESSDDLSDLFESPRKRMQFKPPPVIPKKKVTRRRKPNAKQQKKELETEIFETVLRQHSSADGVSSDDLQMALAFSMSLADTNGCSNGEAFSTASLKQNAAAPAEKEDIIRETLKKFGFRNSDSSEYDHRDFFANFGTKRKWNSKFTPLTRRNDYMQQLKFKNKVKRILKISEIPACVDCDRVQESNVTSHYLQQFLIPQCPAYRLSTADTSISVEAFYVKDLVPISTLRCGCLLKSWAAIPGRDVSPQRSASDSCNTSISTETHNENVVIEEDSTGNVNGAKEPEQINFSQVNHSANDLNLDQPMEVDIVTGDHLANEREVISPDMFADYELSPNISLNDNSLPGLDSKSPKGKHCETEDIQNVASLDSKSPKDSHSETEGMQNVASCEMVLIESSEELENAVPEAIVLSSDDSNPGCPKVMVVPDEPKSVVNEPKSIFNIPKHLSFTDRLELYNSDLALGHSADDDYAACQLSQDSVVISDDEINYSLNRGADDFVINGNSQESIALSDSDDQLPVDDIEERQSFASIEMCNENDIDSKTSLSDDDRISASVRKLCEEDIDLSATQRSQQSIVLSDSDDQMEPELPEDEFVERQSFASIEMGNENDFVSDRSLLDEDINIDDERFNSNHSLNDEDLVNLSVREMCRKEFVCGSSLKASMSNSLSRTQSDMTFERKHFQPSKTPMKFHNASDDEFDDFDKLVRGNRCPSPAPKHSIEISDDELEKSFKSQPSHIRVDDVIVLESPPPPTECTEEFIVQSMDQIYEVRTGRLVSPKPDYENMDSPTRLVHLKKYDLKTLSKRKAVICLEHIYNRLHPWIELTERDNLDVVLSQKEARAIDANRIVDTIDIVERASVPTMENDARLENEYTFFLPSAPRAKKPWCLQPLHIAWHNLIDSNPTLHDDILQYKPIDLMDVRSPLKSIDLRYETNDLISFLDRKCITFKTDNKRNNAAKKN